MTCLAASHVSVNSLLLFGFDFFTTYSNNYIQLISFKYYINGPSAVATVKSITTLYFRSYRSGPEIPVQGPNDGLSDCQ